MTAASSQVQFLIDLQNLLVEGDFTASYKYALLMSLADLSVELGDDHDSPLTLTSVQITQKLIGYYWRQSVPYAARRGAAVLKQNTGDQAKILSLLEQFRRDCDAPISRAKHGDGWPRLVREVDKVIREMPLWKLQTAGPRPREFLYRNNPGAKHIVLLPGVASNFRRFHGLVRDVVQTSWIRFLRRIPQNQVLLDETTDLGAFLFGSEREPLDSFRPVLRELQSGCCFYCGKTLRGEGHVDHFIPFSKYSTDLAHNFVLADRACNQAKLDHLAAVRHLERWRRRNEDHAHILVSVFEESGLLHSVPTSIRIVRWAYEQAEASRSSVWIQAKQFESLGAEWRTVVGAA